MPDRAQKLSAQLSSSTELRLAARVGHLELLTGGKKENRKELKKAEKEAAKKLVPTAK